MQIFGENTFENPIEVLEAFDNKSFIEAFSRIEVLRKRPDICLLGYIRYEAKDIFLGKNIKSELPLLYFEVYRGVKSEMQKVKGKDVKNINLSTFQLLTSSTISYDEYYMAITDIKQEIALGNTYEVNYTYDWEVQTDLEGFELYNSILPRQKTPYNAYIKNEYEEILSFSPELFFEMAGSKIKTKPMKGTIKRGKTDKEDLENIEFLKNDIKNRAENVMIVDLLRNDLGRIAKTGTVKVDKLFEIETHKTLHQMTSEISCEVEDGKTLFDIFDAIFPCGSITGAPKISTMEIIDRVEKGSRGVYCGAIGLITSEKTVFSVPIRILRKSYKCYCETKGTAEDTRRVTLLAQPVRASEEGQSPDAATQKTMHRANNYKILKRVQDEGLKNRYLCRVGGAIVWDSTAEEEWEETLTKISFLHNSNDGGIAIPPYSETVGVESPISLNSIKLVETMLVKDGGICQEKEHLNRMEKSAEELGFVFDIQSAKKELKSVIASRDRVPTRQFKKTTETKIIRLLLDKQGNFEIQELPLNDIKTNKILVSKSPVNSKEPLLYHKTTYRPWYEKSLEKIKSEDPKYQIFDEIFLNEEGELTEGARSNIILQINGRCYTPPVKCGLLKGILRQELIEQKKIHEKALFLEDLKKAEKIFCINSVRGIVEVEL